MSVKSVNGKTGAVVLTAADVDAIPESELGQPGGVATLESPTGTLPPAQLPSSVVNSSQLADVVTDGATDNYALIQDAMEARPNGSVILLPPGPIAVSKALVPPEGIYLGQLGTSHIVYPAGPYTGPVLIGTPGAKLAEVVHLANPNTGLIGVGVNAIPGECQDAVLIDAARVLLSNTRLFGAKEHAAIDSTANASETELFRVFARAYNATSPALIAKGADWLVNMCRSLGQIQAAASGSVWTDCHPVCNSENGGPLMIIEATQHFAGCYFDGSAKTCLIEATSGPATLSGCRFFSSAKANVPIFVPNNNTLIVSGGVVIAHGAENEFSELANNATGLVIDGLFIQEGSCAALWAAGIPTSSNGLVFKGETQASIGGAPLTILNGTTEGTATWSMPFQGKGYKKFVCYLNGYKNTTAVKQKIVFPAPFTHAPMFVAGTANAPDSGHAVTGTWELNATELIMPKEMSASATDWLIIEGY